MALEACCGPAAALLHGGPALLTPSRLARTLMPSCAVQRGTSASTRARQLYPEALCQPMRPRSAMSRRCRSPRIGAVPAVSLGTALERGGTMTSASGCRAATPA